ncbi:MAG: electron transfer flavoprotein subunit alpha/FixB family protein [Thermoplasmatota archaeon]
MADDEWGFADIYSMDSDAGSASGDDLADVTSDDWRNILVIGRATADGVFPETLALVGRARYLADELGCRVEVLLMGEHLDAATSALQKYPIDNIYRVAAPDYAPLDHTAKIVEQVVRKRRPELVLMFQSRSGDAITAFAANRLGVGFVLGATQMSLDTYERRAIVTHQAKNEGFLIETEMTQQPQFVSVQRGLFRAPMEDPYASVNVYDLEIDVGRLAPVKVLESRPPAPATLQTAERVVVAGARVTTPEAIAAARDLADRLGAVFGVTRGLADQGLAEDSEVVGRRDAHVEPKLLVTVGVLGSLEFLDGVDGEPVICAIASSPDDPIAKHAAYLVPGSVEEAIAAVVSGL